MFLFCSAVSFHGKVPPPAHNGRRFAHFFVELRGPDSAPRKVSPRFSGARELTVRLCEVPSAPLYCQNSRNRFSVLCVPLCVFRGEEGAGGGDVSVTHNAS